MNKPHARAAAIAQPVQQNRQTVLWIIAILLAIIATALIVGPSGPTVLQSANAQSSMVGARGIFAFTGQLDENSYGLFMMDVDSSNVWVYQYQPNGRKLKLVAARSFLYDRYLEDYMNDEPGPVQTKMMLDDQRRIRSRVQNGGVAATASEDVIYTDVPGMVDIFDTGKEQKSQDGSAMTPAG